MKKIIIVSLLTAFLAAAGFAQAFNNPQIMEKLGLTQEQEILLALYQNIRSFRFQSSFATFFYRFSRNKAIDLLRQKATERRSSEQANISLFEKTQADPESELIKKQESAKLWAAFDRLKEKEKLLVLMRYVEELSIAEISDITGL